jgi:DNA-binding NarL/FixJ family response regulator
MATLTTEERHGARILIVDDDAFTRKVVRQVLAGLKFSQIDEAEDAHLALVRLHDLTFDLVITDVQMPGINGLELLRRIRGGLAPVSRDTRVIVLTSFANTEVLGAAMALDVNGFLVKPMKPQVVEDKIIRALREELQLRPALGYQSVNTDLRALPRSAAIEPNSASATEARVRASEPRARQILLNRLEAGMHLAEDVLASDRTLLLSRGHTLTQTNINRLAELWIVIGKDSIWITDGTGAQA